jgi:hypothetical protein
MKRKRLTENNSGIKMLGGRPGYKGELLYKPDYDNQAFVACAKLGAREAEVAELLDVSLKTIREWKMKYPSFNEAIVKGKDIYDNETVEKTLLQRAIGFEYDEVTTEEIVLHRKSGNNNNIKLPAKKVKITTKYLPGEISAIFFWLQNRMPDRWKNVKYMHLTGKTETLIKGDGYLSREQLARLSRTELEQLAEILGKTEFAEGATDTDGQTDSSGKISSTLH